DCDYAALPAGGSSDLWGVFVTTYARQRLQQAIDIIGIDCIYCDTDSVKYVGEHEYVFEYLNKSVLDAAKKENDIISVSVNEKERSEEHSSELQSRFDL